MKIMIKLRFPPPPPSQESVNFEDFSTNSYSFSSVWALFKGWGGAKTEILRTRIL